MGISAQDVQKLREQTGAGMMAVKKALEESKGDMEAAVEILRKRGEAKAAERSTRDVREGTIAAYIHSNKKLAAIVSLQCETDFVARTPEFQQVAYDIAMHVAAANPQYRTPEEIPASVLEKEREILREQLASEGIPEKVREKALEGKIKKYYSETCLMNQNFIKNEDTTIAQLITETSTKTGENIQVSTFARLMI